MDTAELNNSGSISEPSQGKVPGQHLPADAIPAKQKRRWLRYLLIAFGTLFLLALIVVIAAVSYYKSLIKNYTDTKPRPLQTVEASKEKVEELAKRWQTFCDDVYNKRASEPFKLTAEEINQVIANFPRAKDSLRVEITNSQIRAHLMIPLDMTGKKELKGRYLNAIANLKLQLEDGFLTLRIDSATANDKPIPGWILNRIRGKNILENLERNYELTELLQLIDTVEVKDGAIFVVPLKTGN